MTTAISEHYEVVVGDENFVAQDEILQTLGVSSAKVLTQTISKHFPDVKVSRCVLSGKGREIVYANLKKRCVFSRDTDHE